MGVRWYIEANQEIKQGSMILEIDKVTICCPYLLLHVEEDEGVSVFTFRGRSVGETIVCRTHSSSARPCCYINGKLKEAPRVLIPFCRKDTKVCQL